MLGPRSLLAALGGIPWVLGRGPSLGVVSSMNAMALPHKVALIDDLGSITFAELERRANRAARLFTDLGVKPGDTVVTLLRNGRHQVEILLAAQKLGLAATPLNTWSSPAESHALLGTVEPKLIVYDVRHRELVSTGGPSQLFVGDPSKSLPRSLHYESEVQRCSSGPLSPVAMSTASPEVIIHTSGTTGTPKGARRDPAAAGVDSLTRILQVIPLCRDDVIFCPAPLFHSFGLATLAIASLLGATLVLPDRFDPAGSLDMIESHRVTAISAVPVMLNRILALDPSEIRVHALDAVRIILVSGSALTQSTRQQTKSVFGDVLYDLYGSTEVGWVAIATPDDMVSRPGSVGRPVPGIELAMFDDQGAEVKPGVPGEIFVKSEVVFEGYTSGETRPHKAGYMSIGDVGHLDSEGFLYVEGRADEMMVIGGENVYPIEIENVIGSIDGVSDVAAFGVPDDEYGTRAVVFVVGTAQDDEILSACRSSLASFKVPRAIHRIEELPRNASGKVLKRELVDQVPS